MSTSRATRLRLASALLAGVILSASEASAQLSAGPVMTASQGRALSHPLPPGSEQVGIEIDALPFTISEPGRYYLTTTLVGVSGQPGVIVDADNVLIDLNGMTLKGVSGAQLGIVAVGLDRQGLSIRNGNLQAWPLGGVDLSLASQCTLEDLTASDCGLPAPFAAGLLLGPRGVVDRCIVESSGADGIVVGTDGRVQHSVSRLNAGHGIVASHGTVVGSCTASNNQRSGIAGTGLTVSECTTRLNLESGVDAGSGSVVSECSTSGNSGYGILVADQCRIVGSHVTENSVGGLQAGIRVTGTLNYVADNLLVSNQRGLWVSAGGNVLVTNMATGNTVFDYSIFPGNQSGLVSVMPGQGFTSASAFNNLSY